MSKQYTTNQQLVISILERGAKSYEDLKKALPEIKRIDTTINSLIKLNVIHFDNEKYVLIPTVENTKVEEANKVDTSQFSVENFVLNSEQQKKARSFAQDYHIAVTDVENFMQIFLPAAAQYINAIEKLKILFEWADGNINRERFLRKCLTDLTNLGKRVAGKHYRMLKMEVMLLADKNIAKIPDLLVSFSMDWSTENKKIIYYDRKVKVVELQDGEFRTVVKNLYDLTEKELRRMFTAGGQMRDEAWQCQTIESEVKRSDLSYYSDSNEVLTFHRKRSARDLCKALEVIATNCNQADLKRLVNVMETSLKGFKTKIRK